jgi:ParB-like chromosome segregation protein Spo0J
MSEIVEVPLRDIKSNPHRHLENYPYVPAKLEALKRSINDVGFWEGVIARRAGNQFEIAFGHHRIKAARDLDETKLVSLIVRDLDDYKMLQFMGRENGEDYNADFHVMLETWEATVKYAKANPDTFRRQRRKLKATDIARALGWTNANDDMNSTAKACANASDLLDKGVMSREDFVGVNVKAAQEVATTANKRVKQFENADSLTKPQKKARIKSVTKNAKKQLKEVAAGNITAREAAMRTDSAIREEEQEYRQAQQTMDKQLDNLASSIGGMLVDNKTAERLDELVGILPANKRFMNSADIASLENLRGALDGLARRAKRYSEKLDTTNMIDADDDDAEVNVSGLLANAVGV